MYIFRTGPNGPDWTEGIKFGLDQTRYLNLMRMFYDLRRFRHLIYRWTLTLARMPCTTLYKEEAAELATL